jgi:hypothetical protein
MDCRDVVDVLCWYLDARCVGLVARAVRFDQTEHHVRLLHPVAARMSSYVPDVDARTLLARLRRPTERDPAVMVWDLEHAMLRLARDGTLGVACLSRAHLCCHRLCCGHSGGESAMYTVYLPHAASLLRRPTARRARRLLCSIFHYLDQFYVARHTLEPIAALIQRLVS